MQTTAILEVLQTISNKCSNALSEHNGNFCNNPIKSVSEIKVITDTLIASLTDELKSKNEFLNKWLLKKIEVEKDNSTFTCRMCGTPELSRRHEQAGDEDVCITCREGVE